MTTEKPAAGRCALRGATFPTPARMARLRRVEESKQSSPAPASSRQTQFVPKLTGRPVSAFSNPGPVAGVANQNSPGSLPGPRCPCPRLDAGAIERSRAAAPVSNGEGPMSTSGLVWKDGERGARLTFRIPHVGELTIEVESKLPGTGIRQTPEERRALALRHASVPNPKFASSCSAFRANFGFERTLENP